MQREEGRLLADEEVKREMLLTSCDEVFPEKLVNFFDLGLKFLFLFGIFSEC